MVGLGLNAARSQFFDRAAVVRAVERGRRKALSQAGAYVRRRARTSIRRPRRARLGDLSPEARAAWELAARRAIRRGQPPPKLPFASSRPGEPPRTPTGILRRAIVFVYDRARDGVVIGPYDLGRGTGAPRTLEYGGQASISRRIAGRPVRRTVAIAARPYMRPALAREIAAGTIPQAFRDSVRGGSA